MSFEKPITASELKQLAGDPFAAWQSSPIRISIDPSHDLTRGLVKVWIDVPLVAPFSGTSAYFCWDRELTEDEQDELHREEREGYPTLFKRQHDARIAALVAGVATPR